MVDSPKDVKSIFGSALELSVTERGAYLDAACAGDPRLRAEVESLLEAHPQACGFFEDLRPSTIAAPETERPGTVIGPYRLLEQIGEGGFGVVFSAEQTQPVRRIVAVKVLKPGMDTPQVVTRFEAERQALAIMDHPHIAKVFDGGATASARPYFVMELVQGLPITDFCEQHLLTPRQRLELFVTVCQAVQHAHQKGIIHRDLKPSNVLVTGDGSTPLVKVIDFGIAKAIGPELTDKTLITGFAHMIGTPLYMSPEQAGQNGVDIDTRSDIYSLGVLLYELLTGTTPFAKERFQKAAYDEIRRIIREEEAPKPSTRLNDTWRVQGRTPKVEGKVQNCLGAPRSGLSASHTLLRAKRFYELDWIVLKALEKDRNRRYETASAFAMDVQRYLADEPVQAGPPSPMYRFGKFARRNKRALTLGALSCIFLLVTVAVLAISNVRIEQALTDRTNALDERGRAFDDLEKQQKKVTETLKEVTTLVGKLKEEQKQTTQALYFHSVALADREWRLNNVEKAEQILDQGALEHRDWEWHYLKRRCHASTILERKGVQATALAFSPDGELLACCFLGLRKSNTPNSCVKVWETRTGKEALNLTIPINIVSQIAFSPDGRQLAVPTYDMANLRSVVRIIDARTGAELRALPGERFENIISVAYRPGAEEMAMGGGAGLIRLVDLRSGQQRTLFGQKKGEAVLSLNYSPDGKRLATAAGKHIQIWDAASGQELAHLAGQDTKAAWVEYSPDGRRLLTSGDGACRIFDAEIGKCLLTLSLETDPTVIAHAPNVAFSPDGQKLLVMAPDRTLRVLQAATGAELFRHRGHSGPLRRVAWSRADRLASVADDGSVRLWQPLPGVKMPPLGMMRTLSSDGQLLASVRGPQGTELLLIDAISGRVKTTIQAPKGVVFGGMIRFGSDNGVLVAEGKPNRLGVTRTGSWHAYEVASGQALAMPPLEVTRMETLAMHGSGSRRQIATLNRNQLSAVDWESGKELFAVPTFGAAPRFLNYSPDGRLLCGVGFLDDRKEHVSKVWDAKTGKELRVWTSNAQALLTFSFDGNVLAAGSDDGAVWIFHVHEERPVQILQTAGSRFSLLPNSKRLASWGGKDGAIKICDIATGRELLILRDHASAFAQLAMSTDGVLTILENDGRVDILDGRPWQLPSTPSMNGQSKN